MFYTLFYIILPDLIVFNCYCHSVDSQSIFRGRIGTEGIRAIYLSSLAIYGSNRTLTFLLSGIYWHLSPQLFPVKKQSSILVSTHSFHSLRSSSLYANSQPRTYTFSLLNLHDNMCLTFIFSLCYCSVDLEWRNNSSYILLLRDNPACHRSRAACRCWSSTSVWRTVSQAHSRFASVEEKIFLKFSLT